MTMLAAISAQTLSTAFVAAVSFALSVLLGRVMGPGLFGDYSFILTAGALFMILQDGGWRNLVYREGADPSGNAPAPDADLPARARGHALVVTVLGLAALPLIPLPEGTGASLPLRWALAAAVACFCCVVLGNVVSSDLRARGRFKGDALWLAALRLASALAVAGTLLLTSQPWAVFAAWGLGLLLCLVPARGLWPVRPGVPFAGPMARSCLAFMLVEGATLLYHRVDIIMLQAMRGPAETGQYAAAYRFLDGVILLAAPVGVVLMRRLRLARRERPAFAALLRRACLAMLLGAAVLEAGALALGTPLMLATFGPDYAPAGALMPTLFAALAFILPNSVLTQAAVADNRERLYALAALACAGVNVGLNLLMIPGLGAAGAAWATVATEGVLTAIMLLSLRGQTRTAP